MKPERRLRPRPSRLLSPAPKQKALRKIRADDWTQRKPKHCVDDFDYFVQNAFHGFSTSVKSCSVTAAINSGPSLWRKRNRTLPC